MALRIGQIIFVFLMSAFFGFPSAAADQPTVMAGQSDSEGFQTVWQSILKEAGINYEFITAPRARKRRLFVEGIIKLDCCAAPLWRTRPKEIETQRWSDTFYITHEQFLFRANEPFAVKTPNDLAKLTVAVVRGFEYRDSTLFKALIPGNDLRDTFRLLYARRVDVGIISNVDFYALAHGMPGKFMLGPVRVRAPQKVRVHKDVTELLPQINEAIKRLNKRGEIINILEKGTATTR